MHTNNNYMFVVSQYDIHYGNGIKDVVRYMVKNIAILKQVNCILNHDKSIRSLLLHILKSNICKLVSSYTKEKM